MLGEMSISTTKICELIDITPKVQDIVSKLKVNDGICVIYCPHTTAAITINENADPDVKSDINNTLKQIIPEDNNYSHNEGNSDAHIKSSLVGCSETVIIKEGKLLLGTWQGIMLLEGDGPRQRKVIVKIIKG